MLTGKISSLKTMNRLLPERSADEKPETALSSPSPVTNAVYYHLIVSK
jgi:hypothetical protein